MSAGDRWPRDSRVMADITGPFLLVNSQEASGGRKPLAETYASNGSLTSRDTFLLVWKFYLNIIHPPGSIFKPLSMNTSVAVFVVPSLSCVWAFATPQTASCQASLSFTVSQSLLKFMSIELVVGVSFLDLFLPFISFIAFLCQTALLSVLHVCGGRGRACPALLDHSSGKVLWGKITGSKQEWFIGFPRMIWVKEGFREEVAFRQETEGEIGVGQLSVYIGRNWRGVFQVCLESHGISMLEELREVQCTEVENEDW